MLLTHQQRKDRSGESGENNMAKRKRTRYPLRSSSNQLKAAIKAANTMLRKKLTKRERQILKRIQLDFIRKKDSFRMHSKKGILTLMRRRFHDAIIRAKFKDKRSIDRKDPDLYILGGVAGSGKSEALLKRIPKDTLVIDSDSFKASLAKRTKSPIRRFPLAHAPLLQAESKILFARAMKKAMRQRRDITLDMTFATFSKGVKIMKRFKRAGFDVHLFATQKRPHQSILHVVSRFIKKGRFVPPSIIAEKGNRINMNVLNARRLADSYIIADTTIKGKPKIIFRSRRALTYNFRNPKRKKRR